MSCPRRFTPKEIKEHRAAAAKIKDRTPERRKSKNEAQIRYRMTDKAALAQLKLWARKKDKEILISDEDFFKFRELTCHVCGNLPERTGVCFLLIDPRGKIEPSNMNPTCGVCKLIQPRKGFDMIKFCCKLLRRGWKRTPMAGIAKQRARKAIGRYECSACKGLFPDKLLQLDHIEPIVDPMIGFVDLETFAQRLFCDENNLQYLCKPCHSKKTALENAQRIANKKKQRK